jgi:phosphomannomutase
MRRSNLKIGVSGIRGVIGESLTPSLVADFCASFGRYVGGGSVIVGRDTRPSGKMLEHAAVAGLLAAGCRPVLVGVAPTPTVQMAVEAFNANGGLAITASHNPKEWNALKFINSNGLFLGHHETAELLDIYNQPDLDLVEEGGISRLRRRDDAFTMHQKRIFQHIDVAAIKRAKFSVAVDCCNGVGALFSRPFLEALGCKVYTVCDEPSGIFERGPEPKAENLQELSNAVRSHNCAVGFAQDPDGDRLALVDSTGHPIGEQYTLILALDHILSDSPGDIVVNIQTSRAVEDLAESYDCQVHYSKVGEINVIEKMLETGAEVGGEGSCGGMIWSKIHPCRDSFVSMALILEMMALSGQSFDDIVASMPQYHTRTVKIPCHASHAREIILEMRKRFKDLKLQTLDGIRIDFPDGWMLMRPSNTEPVIRITVEAATPQRADEILSRFENELRSCK